MRRTWRALAVAAAVTVLAVLPLSAAAANGSPATAHSTAMGAISLGVSACC
jgi:hypothetical protein